MFSKVILFDRSDERRRLLPLVATRPVGNLRVGIHTLDEKWSRLYSCPVGYLTMDYLADVYNLKCNGTEEVLLLNANVLPNADLLISLSALSFGQMLLSKDNDWIAVHLADLSTFDETDRTSFQLTTYPHQVDRISYPEDIFIHNASQILFDLNTLSTASPYVSPAGTNTVIGEAVFMEEGAQVAFAHLDASMGPIYIGKGAVIEDGVSIKGPAAICANSRVKTGARIYPNVTIGVNSTVCGEINNTVIWGNSAKGHEGYVGCAVIGEGCNLGAGTNNSNLRNDWKNVKLYDYYTDDLRNTGLLKCGFILGDHSMLAINSRITTGTVIGVGAQIAISNFIPKFVSDFTWLVDAKTDVYTIDLFFQMLLRKASIKQEKSPIMEEKHFRRIFELTTYLRNRIINTKNI